MTVEVCLLHKHTYKFRIKFKEIDHLNGCYHGGYLDRDKTAESD